MTQPAGPPPPPLSSSERRLWKALVDDGFSEQEAYEAVLESRSPGTAPGTAPTPATGPQVDPGPTHTLRPPGAPVPPPAPPATGAVSYWLGFLGYLPIPMLSLIIAGIAMVAARPGQRRRSAVADENSRYAANWGLTVITVVVLSVALAATLAAVGVRGSAPDDFNPALMPLLGIVAVGAAHLVVLILGLVRANRGEVFVNRLAIPFLRRR